MKMIFLVDGDNNIGTGLQGIDLLTAEDTVLVFFGKGQTLANVKKLCAGTKAQVQYLESVKGGKNSLDFQIITELGVLVGRGEADFAYVISQDKGYEAAMSALHARYASTFREVALRPSIQDCLQAAFLLRAGTREELAAALARQNLADNGLAGEILPGDLRDRTLLAGDRFHLVVSNPPYFRAGSGKSGGQARMDDTCSVTDLCQAAGRLVRTGGRFALVYRPERLAELFAALAAARLEPKRMQLLAYDRRKPPYAVLVEAVKDGGPGLEVLPVHYQMEP